MGEMNFLLGGYKGKLGTTYGTKYKRSQVVKIIPFSHTPHSDTQKRNFNTFGIIQRLASPLQMHYWRWLDLTAKNISRQNACASWLKPLMQYPDTPIEHLQNIVGQTQLPFIKSQSYNLERNVIEIDVNNEYAASGKEGTQAIYLAYQSDGKCIGYILTNNTPAKIAIPVKLNKPDNYYIYEITQKVIENGKTIRNASYQQLKVSPWSGETLRTQYLFNGSWYFRDPETLVGEGVDCEYDGERLIL